MLGPFNPKFVREQPLQGLPGDVATASHAAAVVTYGAAGFATCHGVNSITVGFVTTPAAPVAFTIADGSTVIFTAPITAAGAVAFTFDGGKMGSPDNALTITLPDGGSGVVGSVSVGTHFLLANQGQTWGADFAYPANSMYAGAIF